MSKNPILFYAADQKYGAFSNFSRHHFEYKGCYPWFAESAYQGMKFHPHRPDLVKACMRASSARSAANIGRDYRNPLRDDWDNLLALGKNPYQGIMLDDGRGPG